jgi:hypothetical protein
VYALLTEFNVIKLLAAPLDIDVEFGHDEWRRRID